MSRKLIGLFIKSNSSSDLHELVEENLNRISSICDLVVVVNDSHQELRKTFIDLAEQNEEDHYVWVQYDLDWVDDPMMVRHFYLLAGNQTYYTKRYTMIKEKFYDMGRMDSLPQLFPIVKGEKTFYSTAPPLPKYAFDLPSIKEPKIEILDYFRYGNRNGNDFRDSSGLTLREWEYSTPNTYVDS